MVLRLALPIAVALAAPAYAQDVFDPGLPPPLPELIEDAVEDEVDEQLDDALEERLDDEGYGEEAGDAYETYEEYSDQADTYAEVGPTVTEVAPSTFGYSSEQRDAWLDQCRTIYGSGEFDTCGDYITQYEQTYAGYLDAARPTQDDCEDVVEEVIEEPVPAPVARQPDKRIKLQPI